MPKLSKADYALGCFCSKALWLKKNNRELYRFSDENDCSVQNLAHQLYPAGIRITAEYWDVLNGVMQTKKLAADNSVLFNAVAELPQGMFCHADILQKDGRSWNLIEIKAANSVKPEHVNDITFQYNVFSKAGYPIKNCFVLHLNKDYVRGAELDVYQLFVLENVTDMVLQKSAEVAEVSAHLLNIELQPEAPQVFVDKKCLECEFYSCCGKGIPEYSILNIFRANQIKATYDKNASYDIMDLAAEEYSGKTAIDIRAWQNQEIYVDKVQIQNFLDELIYPLYYLDDETFMSPVPLFSASGPYQQIPFQFSLHIQDKPGGECRHISFLHKERSDPRRAMAECMVQSCGKTGSVVVYNEVFEKTRNKELAAMFPDLADDIYAINDRVVDQLLPFRNRGLYHYSQHSSASIKKVLPAFASLSYDDLEIHNGSEAMEGYLDFIQGNLLPQEEQKLFASLETYCEQDTYAMVLLMDVLYQYAR